MNVYSVFRPDFKNILFAGAVPSIAVLKLI